GVGGGTGRDAGAARRLGEALRLDPSCPAALQGLAELAPAAGRRAEAAREPARTAPDSPATTATVQTASAAPRNPVSDAPASGTIAEPPREFAMPEPIPVPRSEERRVGKEWRTRWWPYRQQKKKQEQ